MKFFKMIFFLSARPLRSRAPARHTGAPPRRSAERAPVGRRRALPRTARLRGNNQCQSALCAKSVARAYLSQELWFVRTPPVRPCNRPLRRLRARALPTDQRGPGPGHRLLLLHHILALQLSAQFPMAELWPQSFRGFALKPGSCAL